MTTRVLQRNATGPGLAEIEISAGAGTVTSVGLSLPGEFSITFSPVTTSGTLTAIWAVQNANTAFRGPTSGAASTPAFRLDVPSDQPYVFLKHGFENLTDSDCSFNPSTRVFSIFPTGASYNVWALGIKFNITTTKTVTLSSTVGSHYIYFDSSGVLQESTTPWDITGSGVPAFISYWNGAAGTRNEERHNCNRDRWWHKSAHSTLKTQYSTGLTGTFTNTTLSVASGLLYDEDIPLVISGPQTSCLLWQLNISNGLMTYSISTTPYAVVGGILKYDNAGTLTTVSNNKFVINDVYACNDKDYPIYIRVGTAEYADAASAAASPLATFANLPTPEMRLIYRTIYKNQSGTTPTHDSDVDYRTATGAATGSITSLPASSITCSSPLPFTATNVQAFINSFTLVGGNLAELGTPGVASFLRVNPDGTVTELTAAQMAGVLDHESLTDLLGGDAINGHYHLTQDKRNHVEQYWLPFQRTLTFDQTVDAAQSVVIQGPLTLNGHVITMGSGSAIRILT